MGEYILGAGIVAGVSVFSIYVKMVCREILRKSRKVMI